MAGRSIPTGDERQALFDELSAVFTRCSEQAGAIERDRDTALGTVPDASALLDTREGAVRDAQQKADAAVERANRAAGDAVQSADREFFDAAQAADAKRQQTAVDADGDRDAAIHDANDLYEETLRAIHHATAGLQAVADAEKRARQEREKTVRKAEDDFRDAIRKADSDRQNALDAAMSRQIVAHAAANQAQTDAVAEARLAFENTIADADRALQTALARIPAARAIEDDFTRRRADLQRACDDRKRAIEAKLRGDG